MFPSLASWVQILPLFFIPKSIFIISILQTVIKIDFSAIDKWQLSSILTHHSIPFVAFKRFNLAFLNEEEILFTRI